MRWPFIYYIYVYICMFLFYCTQVIPFESHNGFHKPRDDDQISDAQRMAGKARLRERKIDFSGTFEPVRWSCRAPLPSGRLCPRQDRYKVG